MRFRLVFSFLSAATVGQQLAVFRHGIQHVLLLHILIHICLPPVGFFCKCAGGADCQVKSGSPAHAGCPCLP